MPNFTLHPTPATCLSLVLSVEYTLSNNLHHRPTHFVYFVLTNAFNSLGVLFSSSFPSSYD